MSGTKRTEPTFQRNALAPALLAAAVLFLAPVLLTAGWGIVVLFVVAILALIVGWFAVQARQWVWAAVFAVIAVLGAVFAFQRYHASMDVDEKAILAGPVPVVGWLCRLAKASPVAARAEGPAA